MAATISKLLVANRGEIARRIFRTCAEMGIATVAVHSEADADAPFVREADEAVALGGTAPADSYLRIDAIVSAARTAGADAVHPGYGFLAENAELARACEEAGIVFVGPPPEAIAAMGSKLRARALMEDAGIPVLPGAELDGAGDGLEARAEQVGFPLLAKASAGGGGKGMRVVRAAAELRDAVEGARREAESAFGDGTIFLERYLEHPRHVEIQVIADAHGAVASLHERECSIQRRHQKIVEECPSPAVDPALRERMGETAVRAAKAVGYVGAGTVEFLLSGEEFYFLEMNTRLQVEHPVTELVTGLDLVRLQLLCARGEPLPPEAREPGLAGHAIEARLYAEDPQNAFLPQTGTLERFRLPAERGLRIDSGVEDGSEVSVHYDPMLAKVLAWAPSRPEAAERLAAGLAEGELHGVVTNRDLLVRVLRHPEFLAGETDTAFLERHDPAELGAPLAGPDAERLHAVAAALAAQAERRVGAGLLAHVPSGWRNNPSQPQRVELEGPGATVRVEYALGRKGLVLLVDGEPLPGTRLREARPEVVDLEVEGVRRRYRTRRSGEVHHVNSALGQTSFREVPRYPAGSEADREGALAAPMPGTVVKVGAAAGDEVAEGTVLVVLEAMKMEHELTAPAAGTLTELRVQPGDQVEPGAVLAVVDPSI